MVALLPIVVKPLPLSLKPYPIFAYWHEMRNSNRITSGSANGRLKWYARRRRSCELGFLVVMSVAGPPAFS